VHSVLVERHGEWQRLDFSAEGWSGCPEGTIAVWQSVVPPPPAARKAPLNPDLLLSYFEQLVEEAQPHTEPLRYVLALLLVRKKKLRLEETRAEGEVEFLQFTSVDGPGLYEVRDLQLSDQELGELQETLDAHLAALQGGTAYEESPDPTRVSRQGAA
jgi:hypothetical protein